MAKEFFDYEKYTNFDVTPFTVVFTDDGYDIIVGCLTTNFSSGMLDKAGAQILKNVKFHISPRARKNKWAVADYGKYKSLEELNNYQRCKLEILKRQMPTFFKKYKEANPEQFALFARKLLRPMRDCHCKNRLKSIETKIFQIV